MASPILAGRCEFCKNKPPFEMLAPKDGNRIIDVTGQCFHRLTVRHLIGVYYDLAYFCCFCFCGESLIAKGHDLRCGRKQSCGCLLSDAHYARRTHGMTNTQVFRIWQNMLDRCLNPNGKNFVDYGGRGIYVCMSWRTSFEAFYADMGDPPNGYTLDRINNDGPYSVQNCRWASRVVQQNNKRTNHLITWQRETLTAAQWEKKMHIPAGVLIGRIRLGWDIERVFTTPVRYRRRKPSLSTKN